MLKWQVLFVVCAICGVAVTVDKSEESQKNTRKTDCA
jgi:hypothetical protein